MNRAARVVVVDDNELARAGLRNLLDDQHDFEIVGEAGNGAEALVQSRALQPDLLLVDMHMPGVDGLEVTRAVKYALPATHVVIVTLDDQPGGLLRALRAGADAYVVKGTFKARLLQTLREALGGESLVQREVASFLLQALRDAPDGWRSAFSEQPSSVERKILMHAASGDSRAQIARALDVDPATVSAHVSRLLAKMGVVRP